MFLKGIRNGLCSPPKADEVLCLLIYCIILTRSRGQFPIYVFGGHILCIRAIKDICDISLNTTLCLLYDIRLGEKQMWNMYVPDYHFFPHVLALLKIHTMFCIDKNNVNKDLFIIESCFFMNLKNAPAMVFSAEHVSCRLSTFQLLSPPVTIITPINDLADPSFCLPDLWTSTPCISAYAWALP
jgi:hypothetical protein